MLSINESMAGLLNGLGQQTNKNRASTQQTISKSINQPKNPSMKFCKIPSIHQSIEGSHSRVKVWSNLKNVLILGLVKFWFWYLIMWLEVGTPPPGEKTTKWFQFIGKCVWANFEASNDQFFPTRTKDRRNGWISSAPKPKLFPPGEKMIPSHLLKFLGDFEVSSYPCSSTERKQNRKKSSNFIWKIFWKILKGENYHFLALPPPEPFPIHRKVPHRALMSVLAPSGFAHM